MASPAVVGAGVVGGTAAVGATSVAAYHAFNKNGADNQTKEPSKKAAAAENNNARAEPKQAITDDGSSGSSGESSKPNVSTGNGVDVVAQPQPNSVTNADSEKRDSQALVSGTQPDKTSLESSESPKPEGT
ncbi:hypothetical protein [Candidatus Mycoplasma haematohominis]|uniref:Uncharacterized protein n=1 Tax=Candidatus Mycoplasma haematohominis TaxID=1494318 RepID=A0A478FPC6_9MOLU|nr:hypothetical protein [Candidatus Mycoplasma haemohominis]GCE63052.1 hypothetical protein MHSWG343_00300 [Candidatus Mycoplasma haemohominis]